MREWIHILNRLFANNSVSSAVHFLQQGILSKENFCKANLLFVLLRSQILLDKDSILAGAI
jgi:hypothetical protein